MNLKKFSVKKTGNESYNFVGAGDRSGQLSSDLAATMRLMAIVDGLDEDGAEKILSTLTQPNDTKNNER